MTAIEDAARRLLAVWDDSGHDDYADRMCAATDELRAAVATTDRTTDNQGEMSHAS